MLIMTLAYAQRTNDIAYLKAHYPILVQWSNFLVNDSLIPANQLSTDDFAGKLQNQTNLALKGIIGIGAMGEIARLTGNSTDAKKYSDISKDFIAKWQVLGINKNPGGLPHTSLAYGDSQSHGLLYNIWADLELGLNLVPKSVYDMQSAWYPTVAAKYGVPLDTRHAYTKGRLHHVPFLVHSLLVSCSQPVLVINGVGWRCEMTMLTQTRRLGNVYRRSEQSSDARYVYWSFSQVDRRDQH